MRTAMLPGAIAVFILGQPLYARQTPIGPPQSDYGCLRTDMAATAAQVKSALDEAKKPGTTPAEVDEVQKKVAGCVYYKVTLASKMTIEDTENPDVTSTISGKGSITFGLAPDNTGAGYDFTSGEQDLNAPFYWNRGSALITRAGCIVTTVELPYTPFAFWLGVTNSPTLKVGVRISPADQDLHNIATRCKDPLGKWHDLPPSKEPIFTPAWIRIHGEGKLAPPQTADQKAMTKYTNELGKGKNPAPPKLSSPTGDGLDMQKLMALDPQKLAAMAENMDPNKPGDMAKLTNLMKGVVPDADKRLAAAQDNFMFFAPGDCAPVNAVKIICTLPTAPKTMPDRLGYGTFKKITESTTITIEKVAAPPGGP
jgi:hypothetical protein